MKKETTPNFDLEYLHNFSNGDQQFIKEIVQTFLTEIPSVLEGMNTAIIDSDWKLVHNNAHRLKTNFMMLGMKDQQLQAKTIELMIKQKDINKVKITAITKQIKETVKVVFPLLKKHLKNVE